MPEDRRNLIIILIFARRQKELNYHFNLFFGNQPLVQANMTKFLGVYMLMNI